MAIKKRRRTVLHWIPGHHPAIPGNVCANTEARRTAKSDMKVYEWELVHIDLQPDDEEGLI